MTVLHINSSARSEGSSTRVLGQYLIEALGQPVVGRDLGQLPLPAISAEDLIGVHGSAESSRPSLQLALAMSNQLIDELKAADTLILAAPMYNFGIPVVLKQWIDAICRVDVSFKYTQQGPVGLLGIKRAYVITSSGGTPIGSEIDFVSRYLEHICRFIGIEEVMHIDASGSKGTPETIIARGKQQIDALLSESQSGPHSAPISGAA